MSSLAGQRIVVTRDQRGSGEFADLLRTMGADPVIAPLFELVLSDHRGAIDQALRDLETYDWILFTSPNAVRFFCEAGAAPRHPRICAIGPATKLAVEERGMRVDLMPSEYVAEGVVAAFAAQDLPGQRVLLPRAAVARDLVPDALTALGASVDVVEVYRNLLPEQAPQDLSRALTGPPPPDWIT
ncbi:MAG: uroporphyrinogen-III synthase, partial [Bryobacteraceae bacterium]